MDGITNIRPFVKWAGGKTQLIPEIRSMLPESYNRYFEPFLGGGALFLNIKPEKAVINDINPQLINAYSCIRNNPEKLIREMDFLQDGYNSIDLMKDKDSFFLEQREKFNKSIGKGDFSCRSAALFIFLNKACFNGLYRVNREGKYNVPSGHKQLLKIYDRVNIEGISETLKAAEILCGDFEEACLEAGENDFVFIDSPYYNTFDTYQAGGFSEGNHIRLYRLFKELTEKGAFCMLTNNNCDFIKRIYTEYNIIETDVKRSINRNGAKRKGSEIIITNYKKMP